MDITTLGVNFRLNSTRWLLTACLLSALFALPFNLMPIVLGSAADYFALDSQQIGVLGSSITSGWVIGCGLTFWAMRLVSWRAIAFTGVSLAIGGCLLSLLVENPRLLYSCWVLTGFGSAAPFCIALKILTLRGGQERNMGIKLAAEVFLGAALLYLFPVLLVQHWLYPGAALGMAIVMALAFAVIRHIPAQLPTTAQEPATKAHHSIAVRRSYIGVIKENYRAWLALLALLIFFGGQTGLWAFLERIGQGINVTNNQSGMIFSILKLLGGAAGVITAVLGSRYGLRWPHLVGVGCICGGIALLHSATTTMGYALGSWLWEFGFALSQCYQMAAIIRLDISQRLIVLAPAAAGIGAIFGPAIAGFLKTGVSYAPILIFTLICSFIGSAIFICLLSIRWHNESAGGKLSSPVEQATD